MKRLFDLAVSLVAFVLSLPLLLMTAILVFLSLGAPVIFTQKRPGLHGKVFSIYKFRSMSNATDKKGELLPNDQRLNVVGRFIRKTSLDELPSLWNVVKGDMSVVGPRPLKVEYLELYNDEQARRHDVRPGLTGWAQVNGRNNLSWQDRFAMDVWYVDNQSLFLDLKIILLTAIKVLRREGVDYQGDEVDSRFTGNE